MRLRAVAYRMLGSMAEADDAVQEAWLRLNRADGDAIDDLGAWLTTVVARVSLNMLRSRRRRREDPLDVHMPDPIVSDERAGDPQAQALLAESVGLALMVVLDTLSPDERLAFVLHDMFDVPFDEVAPLVERTPAAARQLASRARRRVRADAPMPDRDVRRQRRATDAFFAAARDGDFEALVAVLHPDVVLRSDGGAALARHTAVIAGAEAVARQAVTFGRLSPLRRPVLVNGVAGVVVAVEGRPLSVMAFTVTDGKIAAIDVLADPERLAALDVTAPHDPGG